MKTIKTKLFFIFMVLMISLVLSGILLNSIFLESYYVYKNKGTLISLSDKIANEYITNKENSYEYIDMIQSIDGINTIIVDNDFNVEYNSFRSKSVDEEKRLAKEVRKTILDNQKKLSKKYVYYIDEKDNNQKTKLIYISKVNDEEYLILIKSVKSIHDSVQIANQFYIFAGCIVICVGAIFILIFSKKITKPIIDMSNVAENISNLKFDKVRYINSEDEIGRLGESINKISDKLNKSISELKQDVESKKELVRNMSHELKTPIGIIKGYAEGLKYGVASDKEKMDKYCSILVEECDRMDKLVKELLNYSMIEGGMIKLNIISFDIYEFISTIIERFRPIFNEKNINFKFECIKGYEINADSAMLEKAINNFITNAIDHVDEKKIINVIVEEKENRIKISVSNTGDNIPEVAMDKIWDVCYKVDRSRSRKYGGHGIGLSLVRLIAKLHGGVAVVENVEDGVIFSIELLKD
ncbi:HAMP domain-containing sensor histidine kinase [Clostridium chromiireducens]|uniref:histidine kinase n=1 Tax=Clostridium chromiireducens TaxID=225345 RepID=A0A1V4IY76_9CLOT|nr:HAMP domain-containing sensor histidine kinase [Clostridium chromiireducens]OPJ64714.1 alkaline phosphatase synthesis sensor protein PhoR [Clostridium chromiireducens]RII35983.1 sensor histidine kinase [Clostridium chromiireducens]